MMAKNALYTAYFNNIEARKDWARIAVQYPEIAAKHTPPEGASYRIIDKSIAKVLAEVSKEAAAAPTEGER